MGAFEFVAPLRGPLQRLAVRVRRISPFSGSIGPPLPWTITLDGSDEDALAARGIGVKFAKSEHQEGSALSFAVPPGIRQTLAMQLLTDHTVVATLRCNSSVNASIILPSSWLMRDDCYVVIGALGKGRIGNPALRLTVPDAWKAQDIRISVEERFLTAE